MRLPSVSSRKARFFASLRMTSFLVLLEGVEAGDFAICLHPLPYKHDPVILSGTKWSEESHREIPIMSLSAYPPEGGEVKNLFLIFKFIPLNYSYIHRIIMFYKYFGAMHIQYISFYIGSTNIFGTMHL